MKRAICVAIILCSVVFCACSSSDPGQKKVKDTKTDIGQSAVFSDEDRSAAADCIINMVKDQRSIAKLYSLTYAGDERSQSGDLSSITGDRSDISEYIVFYMDFRSAGGSNAGGLKPDSDYSAFPVTVGRADSGEWSYLGGGYT